MPTCILCSAEIDGTSGVVDFPLGVPVAKCHACGSEFRAEFIRWLRALSVERGARRQREQVRDLALLPGLPELPAFGPVS